MADVTTRSPLTEGLPALAAPDFGEAASWLLESEGAARALAPDALRRLVDGVVGHASEVPASSVVAVLLAYADVVSGDAATAGIETLPASERPDGVNDLVFDLLKRQPTHAGLLRLASRIATARGDVSEARGLLIRLGRADGSYGTIQYARRAQAALPPSQAPAVRVALVSSFTVEPLVAYLDLECRSLGLTLESYISPLSSWARDVLDEASGLRSFAPDLVAFAISIDDLVPGLDGSPAAEELQAAGSVALDRVLGAARSLTTWFEGLLVVHGFHSAFGDPSGVIAGRNAVSRSRWLADLNARLADGLRELPRAYLLDMTDLLMRRPRGAIENPKMRHLAGMRLGEQVLGEVAGAYARFVAPLKGLTRKCVVLDLDNTLWGGVVGELGPQGIKLGLTSPGVEYREFQRYLLTLRDRGLLLAINSKNNPDDALAVIRSHEGMLLREQAFSAMRVNWLPKHENMVSLAQELNIGVDSMVFLDDNPHERELMRQMLPQVLTPELPTDPALLRSAVEALPQLQTLVVTDEDRMRAAQYESKRERERLRQDVPSVEDYLRSLDIEVAVALATDATLPRVQQLFERTNQFNLTARRYDAAQLGEFHRSPDWRIYTLRARDRFGDHGLVATALVAGRGPRWVIDSFLMSCRVIGLGVETALLGVMSAAARRAGAATLVGEYIETKKNAPARDLFQRHGFVVEDTRDGVTRWARTLEDGGVPVPVWTRVVE